MTPSLASAPCVFHSAAAVRPLARRDHGTRRNATGVSGTEIQIGKTLFELDQTKDEAIADRAVAPTSRRSVYRPGRGIVFGVPSGRWYPYLSCIWPMRRGVSSSDNAFMRQT